MLYNGCVPVIKIIYGNVKYRTLEKGHLGWIQGSLVHDRNYCVEKWNKCTFLT